MTTALAVPKTITASRANGAGDQLSLDTSLSTLATLASAGAMTETELTLAVFKRDLTLEELRGIGRDLGKLKRSSSWWIGDLILYGEGAHGEMYSQIEDEIGLDRGTLQNYVWVCKQVTRKRRKAELPFGHHAVVAPLSPTLQRKWLGHAIREGTGEYGTPAWKPLTRDLLRKAIREAGDDPGAPEQPQWSDREDGGAANLQAEIEQAARLLVRDASDAGDGQKIVPAERVARLAALLGEDD